MLGHFLLLYYFVNGVEILLPSLNIFAYFAICVSAYTRGFK